MIARLRGQPILLQGDSVIIDVNGTGYDVICHARDIANMSRGGEDEVVMHIHTSVSDDAIRLYGFLDRKELQLFTLLLGVERIGPKAAMGIVGKVDMATLITAIRENNSDLVATAPGIGRKTAERLILELRDKVTGLIAEDQSAVGSYQNKGSMIQAIDGLVSLGFNRDDAQRSVVAVTSVAGNKTAEQVVAAALRWLDGAKEQV